MDNQISGRDDEDMPRPTMSDFLARLGERDSIEADGDDIRAFIEKD